jgi:F-type H+-transporting ATPase subunit gamma
MPSLKDTKRRIVSVKNTQKITRAMKLVSSAKYARANAAVLNARPYSESFERMIGRLVQDTQVMSPLTERREEKKALLLVVLPDRGLCGSLNANVIKHAQRFVAQKIAAGVAVDLILWGKRAQGVSRGSKVKVLRKQERVLEKPTYGFAEKMATELNQIFVEKNYDRIYCSFSKFRNAMLQTPMIQTLLPIEHETKEGAADTTARGGFIMEPSRNELMEQLLNRKVAVQLYTILLEGSAAEHAARMTAMDSATNNADDVIRKLTLEYNRARQAAITKELIEITSGAEAL